MALFMSENSISSTTHISDSIDSLIESFSESMVGIEESMNKISEDYKRGLFTGYKYNEPDIIKEAITISAIHAAALIKTNMNVFTKMSEYASKLFNKDMSDYKKRIELKSTMPMVPVIGEKIRVRVFDTDLSYPHIRMLETIVDGVSDKFNDPEFIEKSFLNRPNGDCDRMFSLDKMKKYVYTGNPNATGSDMKYAQKRFTVERVPISIDMVNKCATKTKEFNDCILDIKKDFIRIDTIIKKISVSFSKIPDNMTLFEKGHDKTYSAVFSHYFNYCTNVFNALSDAMLLKIQLLDARIKQNTSIISYSIGEIPEFPKVGESDEWAQLYRNI